MKTQWILAAALSLVAGQVAVAADTPGVTATEIKIGGVFPFSGPASSLGLVGRGLIAYIQSLNDRGGINGRKINYITYDDGYSPPKTVEHVRKLVESDEVAFMYGQLGTAGISATAKYLRTKGVPSVAIISGSAKFTNVSDYPLITTGLVSYDTEGKIYAKYLTKALPNAKYAILYQNDDLGKDYVNAFKSYLGKNFDSKVVSASYEVSEPTIDSQVTNLKSSGAEALVIAGTPKFAAQAIKKVKEIDWKALHLLNNVSASVGSVLKPAGFENSQEIISAAYLKDVSDPQWKDDPGMKQFLDFMAKEFPEGDKLDGGTVVGYAVAQTLVQVLKQCGDDLTRENVMKQAASLRNFRTEMLLPGITINTSATDFAPVSQLQLMRFKGEKWELFGDVISADVGG
ncbi:MAG: ABC transporter substrate-binding protein [Bradyrhizobium sp.]|nr:ABC transporter substrate-binding protein [Bradyrhizobium sp.]